MSSNNPYSEITQEILDLSELCRKGSAIDPALYEKLDVKRGLRDINGKGVLAERWFLEPFSRDDWSGGFAAFLDGCEEYLRMDAEGAPFDQGTDPERLEDLAVVKWLVVILVPLLTALVVCLVMKGKMKSARLQTQADAYITQDSLRLTRQDDRYITTTQTRVKIETAKSGGTSVNSGGFSHSSGKF